MTEEKLNRCHESCGSSLGEVGAFLQGSFRVTAADVLSYKWAWTGRSPVVASAVASYPEGISLTVHFARQFEVVMTQLYVAGCTLETMWVMLLPPFACHIGSLHVLSFDAFAASGAQRVLQLVVMIAAVGMITNDVELSSRKRRFASPANKAFFVIPTSQSSICTRH